MKLSSVSTNPRRDERGSAVILVMAMVAIMMIFVAVNTVAVRTCSRELKLLEKSRSSACNQNHRGKPASLESRPLLLPRSRRIIRSNMTKAAQLPAPADGIKAIEYSVHCFNYSLASLIPVLGLPMALVAFSYYRRARRACRGSWNPAGRLLAWGNFLSSLGLIASAIVMLMLAASLLKLLPWQYGDQYTNS